MEIRQRSVGHAGAASLAVLLIAAACPGAADPGLPAMLRGEVVSPDTVPDPLIRKDRTPVYRIIGPAQTYARNCQGCHGLTGVTVDEVPDLARRVGIFARLPEGRAYLVQVPNVAQARLSDAELTELLNWMLPAFSETELPEGFRPFDTDEVRRLRRVRIDPAEVRAMLVSRIEEAGLLKNGESLHWAGE